MARLNEYGFGSNPYTRRFRGLVPVKQKPAPAVVDENTTFADFYDEADLFVEPTTDALLDTYKSLSPADQQGRRGRDILAEVADNVEDLYFSDVLKKAFPSDHLCSDAAACTDKDCCALPGRVVETLLDAFGVEEEFKGVRESVQSNFGAKNPRDEVKAHTKKSKEDFMNKFFPKDVKSREVKPRENLHRVAQTSREQKHFEVLQKAPPKQLTTVTFSQCTHLPRERKLRTEAFTLAQHRPTLAQVRAHSFRTEEPSRSYRSPIKRQYGKTVEADSSEGTTRRPAPTFQTAADALAEANAKMGQTGNGPTFKRPGLSRMAYNPPFARQDPPEQKSAENQKAKKPKTEDEESLEGLPAYLLNEDGTALHPRVASCDPKLLATVCREIMDAATNITWDDIAGLKNAKATLEEVIIWPMLRPDLFSGLRGPPKGILLFGPPGTGKTLLAKAVASQTGCTFFNISASSLMSKWIGDGEKMVRCLFAIASVRQPAVVFIDEIDSLLSARTEGEQDACRRIKTEFLVQLDGAGTDSTDRVLVIGATNRPEELDEAARRRLERRLYVALPDASSRQRIIQHLLRKEPNALSEEDMQAIVERTAKYSGADMKALCREAAMRPLRECRSLKSVAAADVRAIMREDFEKAVQTIRPTVSDTEIQRYADWNAMYGSTAMADGM